ncbi:MAG: hypothetical protein ACR2JR_13895 [Rubrobacteraceae bacterium]
MDLTRRIMHGALGGAGGTLALTALRQAFTWMGLVHTTAPEQVVDRLEELGGLEDASPGAKRALTVVAHFAYGVGLGAALALLRRERGDAKTEAAVGSALGLLAWGAGWSSWLPLLGVHSPPWRQQTPKVLLPVLDHAVFGAVWGLIYRASRRV